MHFFFVPFSLSLSLSLFFFFFFLIISFYAYVFFLAFVNLLSFSDLWLYCFSMCQPLPIYTQFRLLKYILKQTNKWITLSTVLPHILWFCYPILHLLVYPFTVPCVYHLLSQIGFIIFFLICILANLRHLLSNCDFLLPISSCSFSI